MRKLFIGNKLYSSWSLRPWILMKYFDVPFAEMLIPLDMADTKEKIQSISSAGHVPVLMDGDFIVWDSLAIMEYIGDAYGHPIWPKSQMARAHARSLAAEVHSGFNALRTDCPMNLGKKYSFKNYSDAVLKNVDRISSLVKDCRERFGQDGSFLFGNFSAADAMYLPIITRLDTYSFPLSPILQAYRDILFKLPQFQEWREAALNESWIVEADEVADKPIQVFRRK